MKKIYLFLVASIMTFSMAGQIMLDSSFTISGTADVYARTNIGAVNHYSQGTESLTQAPGTSFANLPGFSLGMFNLISTYETEKYGFVGDIVFGPRGADAVFDSPAPLNVVNQLYGWYKLSDKVTATLGNFNTFLGYEVISPAANFNYSTSYMFSYGPFSHSGLKLDFDLGSGFSLMGALLNPTDQTDYNKDGEIYYGAQLGYSNDDVFAFLNYLGGDGNNQVDLTAGANVTEKVYLGVNATQAFDSFSGAAIYAQVAASDDFSIGIRGEYFLDQGAGIVGGADESVIDFTISANYKVGNFTLIPEIRIDAFSSDDFVVKDVNAQGLPTEFSSSLPSFVLAAVYSF